MKNFKILNFILTFLLISFFSSTVKAFSVSSNIDNNVINIGEEVTYTILFDESIITSDFKLSYEQTAAKLKEKFQLSDQEIEKSMKLYW